MYVYRIIAFIFVCAPLVCNDTWKLCHRCRSNVFMGICLSVCLSAYYQVNSKSY